MDDAVLNHPSGNGFALAERQPDGSFRWVTDARDQYPTSPRTFATVQDAEAAIASGGGTKYTGHVGTTPTLMRTEMPDLRTPSGHQPPRLGDRLGQGGEGTVFQNLDEPGWVVKTFFDGSDPLKAKNQLDNLARARAIPGRADNVVRARPLLNPRHPRSQNWVVREEVLMTNVPPDATQKAQVLADFLPRIPDAGNNLMWGTTASNSTPRWLLIE